MIFSTKQLHLFILCTFPGFGEMGFGETGFSKMGFGEMGLNHANSSGASTGFLWPTVDN